MTKNIGVEIILTPFIYYFKKVAIYYIIEFEIKRFPILKRFIKL